MIGLGPFWSRSGVVFVRADACTIGPSEGMPAIKAAGYSYVCFDPKTGEWADERRLAAANGLDIVAWTRTRTMTDLDTLVMAKRRWAAKAAIFNVEIPDTRVSVFMADVLRAMSRAGTAAVVSDGWLDSLGAWAGFRRWVGSVECFPEELLAYEDVRGCVSHASTYFRAVLPCLGAYGTKWKGRLPRRSDYAWNPTVVDGQPIERKPVLVYPGDAVEDWAKWPA